MTKIQYETLCSLFHEYNEAFRQLSDEIKDKYYAILYNNHPFKPE